MKATKQLLDKALTLYEEYNNNANIAALVDGGEFSAPTCWREYEKKITALAATEGLTMEELDGDMFEASCKQEQGGQMNQRPICGNCGESNLQMIRTKVQGKITDINKQCANCGSVHTLSKDGFWVPFHLENLRGQGKIDQLVAASFEQSRNHV